MDNRIKFFVKRKNYFLTFFLDKFFKGANYVWSLILKPKGEHIKNGIVLFIGPSHLGDILFLTSAIRLLKSKRPDLKIYILSSNTGAQAVIGNPFVTGVIELELPWFSSKKTSLIKKIKSFANLVNKLKELRPEYCINFYSTSYYREHFAMRLANIPQRIGFGHKGFGYLMTQVPIYIEQQNIVEQVKYITSSTFNIKDDDPKLLRPDIFISDDDAQQAKDLISKLGITLGGKILAFNTSAQHNFLWEKTNYIKLINMFNENSEKPILLFLGSLDLEGFVEEIRSKIKLDSFSLLGSTNIGQVAYILKHYVNLLVTVDTGIRHIANAVGCKSLVLQHGASRYEYLGKYVSTETILTNKVPCSPCGKNICPLDSIECMVGITPQRVFSEIKHYLSNSFNGFKIL